MLDTINHGTVRELRMARPPVNAMNPEFVTTLIGALRTAAEDCEGVVISGGDGIFSAGLDLPSLMQLDRLAMTEFWGSFFQLQETVARLPIPVVAAITGHCPAAGTVLSLFCDYRVMRSGKYRMGMNETQVGLIVPECLQQAMVRVVGAYRAERLIVAGAMIGPNEALDIGLVDELQDDAQATVAAALSWCQDLLALPRTAMLGNRRLRRADLGAQFDTVGAEDIQLFVDGWFAEETQATMQNLLAQLQKKKG